MFWAAHVSAKYKHRSGGCATQQSSHLQIQQPRPPPHQQPDEVTLFIGEVRQPGAVEVRVPRSTSVASLVKVAAAELKLQDLPLQRMALRVEGSDSALDPSARVADVIDGSVHQRLFLDIGNRPPPPTGAFAPLRSGPVASAVVAIRAGLVTTTAEGHLLLPEGVDWPCALNHVLYVRHFYNHVYETLLRKCAPVLPGVPLINHRHILTGQPGIGKSVFGWYLIYRLLTEQPHRTILYAQRSTEAAFVIQPGESVWHAGFDILREAAVTTPGPQSWLSDPVLICDSYIPPAPRFPTVVIASPGVVDHARRDLLNHFDSPRYFPVPTPREVLDMRRVAFPSMDEGAVTSRVQLWGPIPRYAFERTTSIQLGDLVERLARLSAESIAEAARKVGTVGSAIDKGDLPHRLFLVHARGEHDMDLSPSKAEYYSIGQVRPASPALARWFLERAIQDREWRAGLFFASTVHNPAAGSPRGTTFEKLAIAALEHGGTFRIRKLGGNSQRNSKSGTSITIPRQEILQYSSLTELEALGDRRNHKLLVPAQKTNEAVDALLWRPDTERHVPVNFTVSPAHGIKLSAQGSGLLGTARALGWTPEQGWPRRPNTQRAGRDLKIKFFFIVPQEEFEKGRTSDQKLKDTTDSSLAADISTLRSVQSADKHISQYVMGLQADVTTKLLAKLLADQTPSVLELVADLKSRE